MIDLETLSTSNNKPVIVELGYCIFNKDKIIKSKNYLLDIDSQIKDGGYIDKNTLEWWFQDEQRRHSLLTKLTTKSDFTIFQMLMHLDGLLVYHVHNIQYVWGNSPTFDLSILRSWHDSLDIKPRWSYRQERDFRTLNQEFFETGIIPKPKLSKKIKYTHNALDDAIYQTKFVQEYLRWSELYRLKLSMDAHQKVQEALTGSKITI